MPFSIQTNVNSLVAQENLYTNSKFQSKTIDELTSGYRINQSGDDAAGLAIANGYRDTEAQLTQGVSNANDGVAQLQIMDGGMSNIGTMLDRLQTLATESATQGFTGNRSVLNNEYQGLVAEIDRQAQSIGLSTGGHFAQNLNIYVGGGESVSGAASTQNGMVALGLANSSVDSKALGLRTSQFVAASATGTDLSAGSSTSVANIANAAANQVSGTAWATFNLSGAGFSNVAVSVKLTSSDDAASVAAKLNTQIQSMGNSGAGSVLTAAQADALRNANITVATTTDSSGKQGLSFTSSTGAFQVSAGSNAANALLGNFATAGAATAADGASVSQTVSGSAALPSTAAATETGVQLNLLVNGTAVALNPFTITSGETPSTILADVNGGGNAALLTAAGVTAKLSGGTTGTLEFVGNNNNQSIQVQASGDTNNTLGFGGWSAAGTTLVGAPVTASGQLATVQFSINGGQAINVSFNTASSSITAAANLTAAIAANKELTAANLVVTGTAAGNTELTITGGVSFRMNVVSEGVDDLGFGPGNGTAIATVSATDKAAQISAQGTSQTGLGLNNDVFSFAGLTNTGDTNSIVGAGADQQVLSFSSNDANGNLQTTSVTLGATGTYKANDIDQAIASINSALQAGNATTKQIVAVKETNASGTAEGIRFISSLNNFNVQVQSVNNYSSTNPVGLYDGTVGATTTQGMSVASSASGAVDITTVAGALQAVSAVGAAVQQLGVAQAAVGRGENQLGYAIDLANSQNTNYSAAESDIRDANVATEAANLTKAQVLQQASIAAMAQANSAPQAILSLLRG